MESKYNKEWYFANGFGEYYNKYLADVEGINDDSPFANPIDKLAFQSYVATDKLKKAISTQAQKVFFLGIVALVAFIYIKSKSKKRSK